MTQENYLKENGWNPTKIVGIPQSIYDMAIAKPGHESTLTLIEDSSALEVFKDCTHFAFIPWLKTNGLWSSYEAWKEGSSQIKENTFDDRLQAAKEIAGDTLVPPAANTLKVPEVPKNETTVPQKETVEARFNKYVERVDHIKSFGFELDTSVNGYVKDNNRFIDANTVKSFDVPHNIIDSEWEKFVQQSLKIEWENPLDKKAKEALDNSVPDVTEGLEDDVLGKMVDKRTKELENIGFKYNTNLDSFVFGSLSFDAKELDSFNDQEWNEHLAFIKDDVAKEKQKVEAPKRKILTVDEQDVIIENRIEALKLMGFVQNPNTYSWVLGETKVSSSQINDFTESGDFFFDQLKDRFSVKKEETEKNDTTDTVVENDTEVSNIETTVEKVETIVEEKDDLSPVVEEIEKRSELQKVKDAERAVQKKVDSKVEDETPWPGDHQEAEAEQERLDANAYSHFSGKSINFFSELYKYNFKSLSINFTRLKKEGEVNVEVTPKPFEDDPAFENMRPLNIKATVEELDKDFFEVIKFPLQVTERIFHNSDAYLKELKENEKKTKAAKEKEDAIKKAVEALEKYIKQDKQTPATLKKRIEAVLDLDPENEIALKEKEKSNQKELL